MGKTILEEAVDDVQALKRAAEENAKNLLVEAMSPRIRDFVAKQLGQENFDAANAVDGQGHNDKVQAPPQQQPQNDEAMPENDEGTDEMEDIEIDDIDDDDESVDDEPTSDDDEDEELDDFVDDDEDADEEDDEYKNEDKTVGKDKDKDEEDKDCKDESVEVTAEDLKRAFAEVLQGGLKEDKDSTAKFGDPQDPNDGEYGLAHKVPGEVAWDDAKKVLAKAKNAKSMTKEAYEKTIAKLARQNAQYAEALKYLKKNLNEMNVFNAKLIYTTKLLQNNLSNKQRISVVEAVDKAKSKAEVELVFNTLSESFKIAGVIGESKSNMKGPRASRLAKPTSTLNENKTQESPQATRWAQLAGLINS